jgi:hypothetical protein
MPQEAAFKVIRPQVRPLQGLVCDDWKRNEASPCGTSSGPAGCQAAGAERTIAAPAPRPGRRRRQYSLLSWQNLP